MDKYLNGERYLSIKEKQRKPEKTTKQQVLQI